MEEKEKQIDDLVRHLNTTSVYLLMCRVQLSNWIVLIS